jgi:hypothetical protein
MIHYVGEPDSEDIATTCDDCHDAIPFGIRCRMVHTGEEIDGHPVVKIVCEPCYLEERS